MQTAEKAIAPRNIQPSDAVPSGPAPEARSPNRPEGLVIFDDGDDDHPRAPNLLWVSLNEVPARVYDLLGSDPC